MTPPRPLTRFPDSIFTLIESPAPQGIGPPEPQRISLETHATPLGFPSSSTFSTLWEFSASRARLLELAQRPVGLAMAVTRFHLQAQPASPRVHVPSSSTVRPPTEAEAPVNRASIVFSMVFAFTSTTFQNF
jgi:hypothetical protein